MWIVDTAANSLGAVRARRPTCARRRDRRSSPPGSAIARGRHRARRATGNDLFVAGRRRARGRPADGRHADASTSIRSGTAKPVAVHSNATGVWWVDRVDERIGRLRRDDRHRVGAAAHERRAERVHARLDGSVWYTSKADDRLGRFSEEVGRAGSARAARGTGAESARQPRRDPGTPGATGRPGRAGRGGRPRCDSVLGSPGASRRGRRPRRDAARPAPRDRQGARGKTGAAAKIPRISCKLSGSKVTCKVAKSGAGRNGGAARRTGGGEGLRLRLSRAEQALRHRQPCRLEHAHEGQPARGGLKAGKYTLVVDVGDVTVRIPMRLR